jgi:bifunctional non-homologous end joining protein LigD
MANKTFPTFVPPMMANSVKEPFDSPDWIFEVKLDGYRGIAVFDAAGKPHLWSRNGLPLETKFPAVAKALSKLKLRSTILDGESQSRSVGGFWNRSSSRPPGYS